MAFKSLGVLTPKLKSWNPGLPYPHIRTGPDAYFSTVNTPTIAPNHHLYLPDFSYSQTFEHFARQDDLLNFLLHLSNRRSVSHWVLQVTARADFGIGSYSGM